MKIIKLKLRKNRKSEKGSISLEQVLFMGAIVGISAFVYGFYDDIGSYFSNLGDSVGALEADITTDSSD